MAPTSYPGGIPLFEGEEVTAAARPFGRRSEEPGNSLREKTEDALNERKGAFVDRSPPSFNSEVGVIVGGLLTRLAPARYAPFQRVRVLPPVRSHRRG